MPDTGAAKGKTPTVAVGANGLPEGVKILPITPSGKELPPIARDSPPAKPAKPAISEPKTTEPKPAEPKPSGSSLIIAHKSPALPSAPAELDGVAIIKHRDRIAVPPEPSADSAVPAETSTAQETASETKAKKRKPGRPKAGRLDVPISSFAPKLAGAYKTPAADAPVGPGYIPVSNPVPSPATGPRRMSDLAPRRPAHQPHHHAAGPAASASALAAAATAATATATSAATATLSAKKALKAPKPTKLKKPKGPGLFAKLFGKKPQTNHSKDTPAPIKLSSATPTENTAATPAENTTASPPANTPQNEFAFEHKHDSRHANEHATHGTPNITKHSDIKHPEKPKPQPKPHVHKVGVPPLHYGHVLAFSLRARIHPRWLMLGMLAATCLAVAVGYGGWLFLNGGLPRLANSLLKANIPMLCELGLLAVLYYIGRSIGQTAIIFGVARESDARPAPLGSQIGVGINTFGRRLRLDLGFGFIELGLLALIVYLMFFAGWSWPVHPQLQVAALFSGFLILLYLLTALALARGLAGVALTLTNKTPWQAAKLGWQLFSHRFELLGLRFVAATLELFLAAPLAALAIALLLTTPGPMHLYAALGIGLLAWLAGALFGAGTAAWWAALYRRLVEADRPSDAGTLLTGYPSQGARPGALTAVVALSTFLIAAALALPWLKFF